MGRSRTGVTHAPGNPSTPTINSSTTCCEPHDLVALELAIVLMIVNR